METLIREDGSQLRILAVTKVQLPEGLPCVGLRSREFLQAVVWKNKKLGKSIPIFAEIKSYNDPDREVCGYKAVLTHIADGSAIQATMTLQEDPLDALQCWLEGSVEAVLSDLFKTEIGIEFIEDIE